VALSKNSHKFAHVFSTELLTREEVEANERVLNSKLREISFKESMLVEADYTAEPQ